MDTKTVGISILVLAVVIGIIYTLTKNNSFEAAPSLTTTSQTGTTGTLQTNTQTQAGEQTFETDPAKPNTPVKPTSPSFPQTGFK